MEQNLLTVLCSFPANANPQGFAKDIISKKLAACINIMSVGLSVYQWNNELCSDEEYMLLIKTSMSKYTQLEEYIQQQHPYDCPEIIALPIVTGANEYLSWLANSLV